MLDDRALWQVVFSVGQQSTVQLYDIYVVAYNVKEAIRLAEDYYLKAWDEDNEPAEPYIHTVKIIASIVLIGEIQARQGKETEA